jgi:hypothetical protein
VWALAAAALAIQAQPYTRGVGVYPGDPKEDFSPAMKIDAVSYRNLALHRAAFHSSSYDYNLTANLVTDGIRETASPRRIVVSTSDAGILPKPQREGAFDGFDRLGASLAGERGWIQIQIEGPEAPEVDRVELLGRFYGVMPAGPPPQAGARRPPPPPWTGEWTWTVSGSDDGLRWKELGRAAGKDRPASIPVRFASAVRNRYYRMEFSAPGAGSARLNDVNFFHGKEGVQVAGPHRFSSAWMSEGSGEEWIYVDLGAACTFDRVALYWIRRPAEASVQVSADAVQWTALTSLPAASGPFDDLKLKQPAMGRYVRVLMTKAASQEGYVLSELEVYGQGGLVATPKPAPLAGPDGRLDLAGGNWRLQRDSQVPADGAAISTAGFQPKGWVAATVPGTVLFSYITVGAVPDPNYGENEVMISDSFFYADFWYRREFTLPAATRGRRHWLNFDGVNWKAEVFLNGKSVGRVEGAFMRGRFDVTDIIRPGGTNVLAVRVRKNATPGSVKEKGRGPSPTGGPLGGDNPTFHASAGWDWISTIRGRNTGLWNDVYLTQSGPVTVEDPRVDTVLPLPDTSRADLTVEATLRNKEAREVSGTLRVRFGETMAELPVSIGASSTETVKIDPSTHPQFRLAKPRLWWPNGYGEPNLYPVEVTFVTADKAVSDSKKLKAGVRQFTYADDGGILKIWINGRRFVARGGNWGFSESTLRYRAREYDAAVLYHKHLNFTMIRNWVGMTADEEFYRACDRYGIAVWQDFWLANPVDGADPADNELFLRNAADYVQRIRNHPSVALYCGRNEGDPPKALDDGLRAVAARYHPGHRYISNSLRPLVSGGGPYRVETQKYYFTREFTKLHSEMGAPHVPALESVRLMMPEKELWPQGRFWQLHDFFDLKGPFPTSVNGYGGADNLRDWMELAQFVNYDTYRGMFEGQSRFRMGLLIWMSHSAWPSILWQTYDYYLNPDAGYFGSRKGAEPLHIQWNPVAETVEVVNYSAGSQRGLTAKAEVLNLDGTVRWEQAAGVDSAEDTMVSPIRLQYPAEVTPVHFIRLTLIRDGRTLSTNFYLRPVKDGDYRAVRDMTKADLEASTRRERRGARWLLTTELRNTSAAPALMVRVKAVREKTGDRILPALYSDNYVPLMAGEKITIRTELNDADTRGETPRITVEGFNLGRVSER